MDPTFLAAINVSGQDGSDVADASALTVDVMLNDGLGNDRLTRWPRRRSARLFDGQTKSSFAVASAGAFEAAIQASKPLQLVWTRSSRSGLFLEDFQIALIAN